MTSRTTAVVDETDGGGQDAVDGGTRSRKIYLNRPNSSRFGGNKVSTAKYTFFSFIPLFLFEQFRRYSNIFFLTIALLQVIQIFYKKYQV